MSTVSIQKRETLWQAVADLLPEIAIRLPGLVLSQSESQASINLTTACYVADIAKLQNGDPESFRNFVDNHQQDIARFLWRFTKCPSELDDLVQTTFIEAYRSLKSYRGDASISFWLRTIATRVGFRYWKHAAKSPKTSLNSIDEQSSDSSVHRDDIQELEFLMQRLAANDRLVLMLHYAEGYSMEEVASLTKSSRAAVKMRVFRAKRYLQKLWSDRNHE
jgi:RNA polymerase sigma-70 factor, ECF subfamily